MEDERKKFLLSRIKREQSLIVSEFQRYKRVYHSREISPEKNQSFIQHITHTMQINNSLVSSLYEYLDKMQMETAFARINTIFNDLIDKYRKCTTQLLFMNSGNNIKQIREICDVCHEKIETNRIQNIRRGLDADSQCRAAVIKKLIEDSEIERNRPVFTEEEDKQFKRQLQKVFKNKQLVLQTNIHETNVFLATVQQEMAEFMVSFRRDFAEWGGQQIQEQNQNWGKLMKCYINKKLTNSFNNKIPNWIKKMHELFVDKQPIKPKQYFMNKQIQVGIPTETQQKLAQQLEELNHSIIMKREALKQKQRQLECQRIRSKALKTQLESIQQYYVDKLYVKSRNQNGNQKIGNLQQIYGSDSVRTSLINLRNSNHGEKTDLNQRQIISRSNKKKFAKMGYQMMIQKTPQELKEIQLKKQQKSRKASQISHNKSTIHLYNNSQKPNTNSNHKQTSSLLSSFEGNISYIDQATQKLKKKAFNRQKRQEMVSEHDKDKINKSASYQENKQHQKQSLKEEVKEIHDEISKDLKMKQVSKQKNARRFNSISITENKSLPHISQELKNPSAAILSPNEHLRVSQHKQSIQSDIKKRAVHITEDSNIEISKTELNQVIDNLVQLSQCENLLTSDDKLRLGKIIKKFFNNLEWKNSKSMYFKPLKMSKVILSENKQNIPLLPFKDHEYAILSKSLKKQYKRKDESVQRKNKSLHTNILKLPAISIKNYHLRQTEQPSIIKDNISLFINQTNAQQFQESFDVSKERNILKPTPSQLQQIQKMFSYLQLIKRQNNIAYVQLCNYLRYPFSSSKEKLPVYHFSYGFNFTTFFNYFLKLLWLHQQCSIDQRSKFCCHIHGFQRQLLSFLTESKQHKIKRTDRLQVANGINLNF